METTDILLIGLAVACVVLPGLWLALPWLMDDRARRDKRIQTQDDTEAAEQWAKAVDDGIEWGVPEGVSSPVSTARFHRCDFEHTRPRRGHGA